MLDPAAAKAIVDAGGWTAFLLLLGVNGLVILAVVRAARKDPPGWVFGWIYVRERDARVKADDEVDQLTRDTVQVVLRVGRWVDDERKRRRVLRE